MIAEGLVLEDVHHAYDGAEVVNGLSLTVAPGEVVCLLGPSGCGKTTLLRVVAGLERLQRGRICIDQRIVAEAGGVDLPPEQRGISLLFQDFALFPHLTVMENVSFGLSHLPPAERRARAGEMLGQVGMLEYADAFPHVLSGGQQQRVALARARAPRPRVMLMDEPFSNLDVGLSNQIRELVLHILKQTTSSMLLVTHDPEEAMFMADRICVMRAGRIEQTGTPHDLYCHPMSAYVAGMFTETNRIPGTVTDGEVDTPIGRFAAPDFADGVRVEVLVRPEAVRLRPARPGEAPACAARVIAARMLGASSIVHLQVAGAGLAQPDIHVHARIAGHRLPREDEVVPIVVDRAQAFVFRADS